MKLQREAGMLMAKIHQTGGRILARKLKEYNVEINPAQGRIMFVLWRNDNISIMELAKRTSLGKSTLTSMLDRLEESGYIKRVPSKQDRRKIMIQRTEKDRAYQDLYIQISNEMNKCHFDGFTDDEYKQFESYLKRIYKNLQSIESHDQAKL